MLVCWCCGAGRLGDELECDGWCWYVGVLVDWWCSGADAGACVSTSSACDRQVNRCSHELAEGLVGLVDHVEAEGERPSLDPSVDRRPQHDLVDWGDPAILA